MAVAKNHKPSGKPSWPRLLLSGENGARKSWIAAELSADERIGGMYWLEVGDGEVTAEEYGAIPNADYAVIEHDGTWLDIYEQLCAHWDLAKAAETAGELPVALTVDAMSGVQSMLADLGDTRARRKLANQLREKGKNPDMAWSSECEVTITPDLWNLIKKRHAQFMSKVLTWPGPVVMTSRERVATVFDTAGNPTSKKDWTLECRKDLPSQCTAWVRLTRGNPPMVIKLRSVRHGVMPDEDSAVARRDFSCAKLIFDWVGCESGVSRAPESRQLNADQAMPDEKAPDEKPQQFDEDTILAAAQILEDAENATTREAITKLWTEATESKLMLVPLNKVKLGDLLTERAKLIAASVNGHAKPEPVGIGS